MSDLKPGQRVRMTVVVTGEITEYNGERLAVLDDDRGTYWTIDDNATVEVLPNPLCPALLFAAGRWYPCDKITDADGAHDMPHGSDSAGAEWSGESFVKRDAPEEHVRRGPFLPTNPLDQEKVQETLKRLVEKAQAHRGPLVPVAAPEEIGTVVAAATDYDETTRKKRRIFVLTEAGWMDENGDDHDWENLVHPVVRHFGWERLARDVVQDAPKRYVEEVKKKPTRPTGVGAIVRAAAVFRGYDLDHPDETTEFGPETRWYQDHDGGWNGINGKWEGADWDDLIDPVVEHPGIDPERPLR